MIYGVKLRGGAFIAFALYGGEIHRQYYCSTREEAEKKIEEWKTPNW